MEIVHEDGPQFAVDSKSAGVGVYLLHGPGGAVDDEKTGLQSPENVAGLVQAVLHPPLVIITTRRGSAAEIVPHLGNRPPIVVTHGQEGQKAMIDPDLRLLRGIEDDELLPASSLEPIHQEPHESGCLPVSGPGPNDGQVSRIEKDLLGVQGLPPRGFARGRLLALLLQPVNGEG